MRRTRAIAWIPLLVALGCAGGGANPSTPAAAPEARKFIVMLKGWNYILDYGGQPTRLGFLTTRHVEAPNAEEAERRAIQEVHDDEKLNSSLLNDPSDPPQLTMTRFIEVESFDSDKSPELGYIFYEDHDTK